MYDSLRDAEFRLNRTTVWYKNRYCFVVDVFKDMGAIKLELRSGDTRNIVSLKDPMLKIRSIPTGYVSVGGKVCYLKRCPTRSYRQGLRIDNSKVSRVGFVFFEGAVMQGTVSTVCAGEERILNRDFCSVGGVLFYKDRKVGTINDNGPILLNNYTFLKECLEEIL